MIGRKGLFGRGLGGAEMTALPDMANIPSTAQGRYGNAMLQPVPQKQPGFWQGGNKFTVRDGVAGALAAIGDGLSNWSGGGGGAMQSLLASRMLPQQQAAAMAAEQRKRAAELADYEAKKGIDARYAEPAKPGSFEWYSDPSRTDAERALYDQYNPVIATTWQGPTPIPRGRLNGGLPSAPVGKLTPVQPTIENTPAPQLNANGMPSALTRAQYQAVEERMGRADTEAWARRNNIRVVN